MKYKVFIVSDAEDDLFEIYKYVAANDSPIKTEKLIGKLEERCLKLFEFPHRGHVPPELERIGVFDSLEILYNPYRIIYRILESKVFVYAVLDGRRDLQDLLQQRLLR
jgi:toxin ParE1/3/4